MSLCAGSIATINNVITGMKGDIVKIIDISDKLVVTAVKVSNTSSNNEWDKYLLLYINRTHLTKIANSLEEYVSLHPEHLL